MPRPLHGSAEAELQNRGSDGGRYSTWRERAGASCPVTPTGSAAAISHLLSDDCDPASAFSPAGHAHGQLEHALSQDLLLREPLAGDGRRRASGKRRHGAPPLVSASRARPSAQTQDCLPAAACYDRGRIGRPAIMGRGGDSRSLRCLSACGLADSSSTCRECVELTTMKRNSEIQKIAFVGDYLPRRCGIATFTYDLCTSVATQYPGSDCFVVPINDVPQGYDYPAEVRFEIEEQEVDSYLRAADFLNFANTDIVSLQHEYGIFGGPAGSHVVRLLRDLRMPIVTTLHTVLKEPSPEQRRVLCQIGELSARMVVMSERARTFFATSTTFPTPRST